MSRVLSHLRALHTGLKRTMKAVRVHEFGGPEVLRYETDVPIPRPGTSEILVNVKAVGINPVETYIRSGVYARLPTLPAILGHDCAGIVSEVGPNNNDNNDTPTEFSPGDRVYVSHTITGSYAEYCLCPLSSIHRLSDKLSFSQGAALPTTYLTAHRAIFLRGHVKPSDTVLVHGASGGVGVAALQLLSQLGVKSVGTAGTEEGEEIVRQAGAKFVYNHREEGYLEKMRKEVGDIDLIVENAAHLNLGKDLQLLARGGRVAIVGSRGPVEINPRDAMSREASISGVMLFNATEEEREEAHTVIQEGIEKDSIKPIVGKEFHLREAATAHRDIVNGTGALGKTVLVVD